MNFEQKIAVLAERSELLKEESFKELVEELTEFSDPQLTICKIKADFAPGDPKQTIIKAMMAVELGRREVARQEKLARQTTIFATLLGAVAVIVGAVIGAKLSG